MKDAEKRFGQTAQEITVTFMPQCNTCIKNVSISVCKEFGPKPTIYPSNEEVCPKRKVE